ncbi:MAG: TipAS antibiotic-recognition domain-containing protein [Candidatus Aminicenantes bacterium]|nr:TipAS antibiotic-recognition domain-containing protein [Candidatus Aminicenantes bacterium]
MEKYYTPEQLKKLKERKEALGDEAIHNAEAEWMELFEKYKDEMDKGTDPAAESVQKLARRSQELIAAFTGGDSGIEKSLGHMYQQEGGPNVMAQHSVQLDPSVWEYMGKAMSALKNSR